MSCQDKGFPGRTQADKCGRLGTNPGPAAGRCSGPGLCRQADRCRVWDGCEGGAWHLQECRRRQQRPPKDHQKSSLVSVFHPGWTQRGVCVCLCVRMGPTDLVVSLTRNNLFVFCLMVLELISRNKPRFLWEFQGNRKVYMWLRVRHRKARCMCSSGRAFVCARD